MVRQRLFRISLLFSFYLLCPIAKSDPFNQFQHSQPKEIVLSARSLGSCAYKMTAVSQLGIKRYPDPQPVPLHSLLSFLLCPTSLTPAREKKKSMTRRVHPPVRRWPRRLRQYLPKHPVTGSCDESLSSSKSYPSQLPEDKLNLP